MSMTVRTWMKHPVVSVKLRDSVAHARELLEEHRVNQLVVLKDGALMGIVTDRDVRDASPSLVEELGAPLERRRRRLPPNADPVRIPVEDVMTPGVLTVAPDAPIAEAASLMRRERVGSLPVVDGGKVVGILTRSDLLDALIDCAGRL
jgi:acetoin utilization protein AcuB